MDIPIQNYLSTCWLISAAASIEYNYPGKLRSLITQKNDFTYQVNLNNNEIIVNLLEYKFCCINVFATTKNKNHWMAILEVAFAKYFSKSASEKFNLHELKFINGGYSKNAYQLLLNKKNYRKNVIKFVPDTKLTANKNLEILLNQMGLKHKITMAWFGSFTFKGKSPWFQQYFKGIILNHSYAVLRVWWDDDYAKIRTADSKLPKPTGLTFLCYNPWGRTTPYQAKTKNLPPGYFLMNGLELIPLLSDLIIIPCI